jgi:DNA-binding MarR family transcriptional regulator
VNERGAATARQRGAVVVGPDGAAMRQALDPTAWVVLEELVLTEGAEQSGTTVVVATSARKLAGGLGLSKDTVAAALRRLARAGVVRREDERDSGSGRFGHSRYVIDLTDTGIRPAAPARGGPERASDTAISWSGRQPTASAVAVARITGPHPRPQNAATDAQLSLLDPDQNPT